jgi:hypothetical protein
MKLSKIITIASSILLFAVLVGCDSKSDGGDSNSESASHSQPNLSLHKPKGFLPAIDRLAEIHGSLVGSGEFPAPTKIDYVEVVHGEGPSGHSHYYLASEYESGGEDDHHDGYPGEHHEEDEKVKHQVFEIAVREELKDVVSWLPEIAAKSDLGESEWSKVSEASKSLTKVIESVAKDATDNSFRDAWKKNAEDIDAQLEKLRAIASPLSGVEK